MRLIDADELKEDMLEESDWWENADVWVAHNVIDNAPTIEPIKRGKWINQSPFDWKCSACGFEVEQYCDHNCCPNCGAKMVGD